MDLKPLRPSKSAPRYPADDKYEAGKVVWGRYNWHGWGVLRGKLEEWGVDTSEFSGCNDGDLISAKTCRKVADAIEAHLPELSEEYQNWLQPHIARWRTCGGYAQH
jgi:hypothetical protein